MIHDQELLNESLPMFHEDEAFNAICLMAETLLTSSEILPEGAVTKLAGVWSACNVLIFTGGLGGVDVPSTWLTHINRLSLQLVLHPQAGSLIVDSEVKVDKGLPTMLRELQTVYAISDAGHRGSGVSSQQQQRMRNALVKLLGTLNQLTIILSVKGQNMALRAVRSHPMLIECLLRWCTLETVSVASVEMNMADSSHDPSSLAVAVQVATGMVLAPIMKEPCEEEILLRRNEHMGNLGPKPAQPMRDEMWEKNQRDYANWVTIRGGIMLRMTQVTLSIKSVQRAMLTCTIAHRGLQQDTFAYPPE
ncbi:hypothetical protein HDV00_006277 [Rhizophlyctis rosea]|nr:hypothetical protein HDV00_006277 [Rhizophlyctis rosea]